MSLDLNLTKSGEAWKKRVGFWATHEYHRSTVVDIEEFIGWPTMKALVKEADELTGELEAVIFESGGRISEVLALKAGHFEDRGHLILVKAMPVFKRKKRINAPVKFRTFPIKKSEALVQYLLARLERLPRDRPDALLFPSPYKTELARAYSPTRAYQLVHAEGHKHGIHVYNHWFRAQRASQLASEYGYQLHDLLEFFKWKNLRTAMRYAHLGWMDLARRMETPAPQTITAEQLAEVIRKIKSGEL